MSETDNVEEIARLERLNHQLEQSLRRCREMLHDYEAQLAANSNERKTPAERKERREA